LKKEIYCFQPLTIYPKNKNLVVLEEFDQISKDSIFEFCPNSNLPWNVTFVKFFPNNKNQIGKLENIEFYIGKGGKPKSPFIVRILSVDPKTKSPQFHLLEDNVIIKGNKDRWVPIDLSNYNITFPKEGLFIGMKWVYPNQRKYRYKTKKRYYVYTNNVRSKRKRRIKLYGQTIRAAVNSKSYFYAFGHYFGNKIWRKQNGSNLFIKPTVIFQQ